MGSAVPGQPPHSAAAHQGAPRGRCARRRRPDQVIRGMNWVKFYLKDIRSRIQKFWSLKMWIGVRTKPQPEPSSSSVNRRDERRDRAIRLTVLSPSLKSVGKSPPTGRAASHMTTQASSCGTLGSPPINTYIYFYSY